MGKPGGVGGRRRDRPLYHGLGQEAQAAREFKAVVEEWPMTEYARYAGIGLERRRRAASGASEPAGGTPNDKTTGEG